MSSLLIKKRVVLEGVVECVTPLHIGSGDDARSDMDVLLDEAGAPFIPASAFIGALRGAIRPSDLPEGESLDAAWGFIKDKDGLQSAVCCSDLICRTDGPKIITRDGIRIDNVTGMVKDQGKFDYELVERGARFRVRMEFRFTGKNEAVLGRLAATILHLLREEKIQVGAKTNNGFGVLRLVENKTRARRFDFTDKKDVFSWLTDPDSGGGPITIEDLGRPFEIRDERLRIDASFFLKNSLIIRAYPEDPGMPEASHLQSGKDKVLPGSSLKGAIRARAEKIVNTLQKKPDAIIKELFGNVEDETRSKNAVKGKLQIRETILPGFMSGLQTRIKVDRFTGGVIEAALFDSMPLFSDSDDKVVKINIRVKKCREFEVGLLLLVLKDLWTGDLAVGGEKNIGRGVFQGTRAVIDYNGETTTIQGNFEPTKEKDGPTLQAYVAALRERTHDRVTEA
ncbi:MAG: hypothetical protein GY859_23505 [Desulfobacterales bacterium]|nr:hypothetical protein [Desulfobacterales bacterium]